MEIKLPNNLIDRENTFAPSYVLPFEASFDAEESRHSFRIHWLYPLVISGLIYLPVLYIGQLLMKNREPFNVRKALLIWNTCLGIFSIVGFTRIGPELIHSLMEHGYKHSVCSNSYLNVRSVTFWMYMFMLSKIPELVDTIFLVLTKKKLIFLHVYHHASVLILCWLVWAEGSSLARWAATMNYGVHAIMYSYYALKALPNSFRIPRWISMSITSLQIVQMIQGSIVVGSAYVLRLMGYPCAMSGVCAQLGMVLYISYLYLFGRFFFATYMRPSSQRTSSKIIKKRA